MAARRRTGSPSPNTSWRLRVSKVDMLDMACLLSAWLSGVHSAIHGKIRPGDVRGLRTGDKRHHRGDFIDVPVAVECRGRLHLEFSNRPCWPVASRTLSSSYSTRTQ